jgi:hypothetical protein
MGEDRQHQQGGHKESGKPSQQQQEHKNKVAQQGGHEEEHRKGGQESSKENHQDKRYSLSDELTPKLLAIGAFFSSSAMSRALQPLILRLNLQRRHELTCRQVHHRISEVQV